MQRAEGGIVALPPPFCPPLGLFRHFIAQINRASAILRDNLHTVFAASAMSIRQTRMSALAAAI